MKTLPSPCIPEGDLGNIGRGDLDVFEQIAFDNPKDKAEEEKGVSAEDDKMFEDFYYNPWHEDQSVVRGIGGVSSRRRSSISEKISNRRKSKIQEERKKLGSMIAQSHRDRSERRKSENSVRIEHRNSKTPDVATVEEGEGEEEG